MTDRPGKEMILICNTNVAFLICAEQHLIDSKTPFLMLFSLSPDLGQKMTENVAINVPNRVGYA